MRMPEGAVRYLTLARLNTLGADEATRLLRSCCAADSWLDAMLGGRPFASLDALLAASDTAVAALDDSGLEQALSAHPRIGERSSGGTHEAAWSRTEQAGALTADDAVTAELAEGNRAYEQRFDRVFLIRAAGRSAEEIRDALRARLRNDHDAERSVVLHELADIVRRRLTGLVAG
jgi:2-oxo-4-hydroxy-4-carboxy-5-ureidoimidazoline decarboxylase